MSIALASRTPSIFELKSDRLNALVLLLKSADIEQIHEQLQERFGNIDDFFDYEPLIIDVSSLVVADSADASADVSVDVQVADQSAQALASGDAGLAADRVDLGFVDTEQDKEGVALDFPTLLTVLRSFRLQPVALRGANAQLKAAAHEAGLLHEVPVPSRVSPTAAVVLNEPPEPLATAPVVHAPPAGPLIIDKMLRAGQRVYARGRDLVVMAAVNAGAEVIADGSIHVYAALRGRAIAGAKGDASARIFALSMRPELISIAGVYQTLENDLPETVKDRAAHIRLTSQDEGEKLLIDPIG